MEFYCYRLMIRKDDGQWLQRSYRLFQEYIVDNYVKIEDIRLNYIRQNQNKLRIDKLKGNDQNRLI